MKRMWCAGRLSKKNPNHSRFEDAYKERVYCWVSASGFFFLCPTVQGSVERPGKREQADAERIDLNEYTACVEPKTKFSLVRGKDTLLVRGKDTLKFKADKPTELALWMRHLEAGSAAARRRTASSSGRLPGASDATPSQTSPAVAAASVGSSSPPAEGYSEFRMIQAAESGDVAQIKALLGRGVSANAAPEVGYTALMAASEAGQLEVIRCLVEASARVDATMVGGTAAVHLAAMCGKLEVVELLSDLGADANACTEGGTTPLMLAAMEGHVPVCMKLHDLGADVNAIESSVIPELEKQIAQLQHDVNESARGLGEASMGGELVPYQDPDAEPDNSAVEQGEGVAAPGQGTLSLPGPDLWGIFGAAHAKNSQVNTNAGAFDLSSVNVAANAAIESMSLNLRANVSSLGGNLFGTVAGNQSLGLQVGRQVGVAVRKGLPAAVRDGLEQASSATSQLGMTALMKAASGGHTEVCRVLTTMGADVNARGHGGMTALMLSAANGHTDTTEVLVTSAARAEIPDDAGNTALEYAMKGGNKECVALIQHLFMSGAAARAAACGSMTGAAAAGMYGKRLSPTSRRSDDAAAPPTLAVALGKGGSAAANGHSATAGGARGRPLAIEGPGTEERQRVGRAARGGRSPALSDEGAEPLSLGAPPRALMLIGSGDTGACSMSWLRI